MPNFLGLNLILRVEFSCKLPTDLKGVEVEDKITALISFYHNQGIRSRNK